MANPNLSVLQSGINPRIIPARERLEPTHVGCYRIANSAGATGRADSSHEARRRWKSDEGGLAEEKIEDLVKSAQNAAALVWFIELELRRTTRKVASQISHSCGFVKFLSKYVSWIVSCHPTSVFPNLPG
jgi:hypothetical protein